MALHLTENKQRILLINGIVFMMYFYLFRATIPSLKFPFLLLYSCYIIFSIKNSGKQIFRQILEFFRNYDLAVLLAVIILISFLSSHKLFLIIFKDLVNAAILMSLFFLGSLYVRSKYDIKVFVSSFLKSIIFFALLIALALLSKFLRLAPVYPIPSDELGLNGMAGALSSDYNIAMVPVFFAIVTIIHFLREPLSQAKKIIYNLLLILFTLTIVLSGSRRGLIMLIVMVLTILAIHVIIRIKPYEQLQKIAYGSKWYIISISALSVILLVFLFIVPVNAKRVTLKTMGIPVRTFLKITTARLYKYSTFMSNTKPSDFQKFIWHTNPDPYHPDSGWGLKRGSDVFPLEGPNADIVPAGAIGYKMDRKCDAGTWSNNAYSYTDISSLFNGKNKKGKSFYASVYCFVSSDFDGNWVRISAEGNASGNVSTDYDMNKKGVWQKLGINFVDSTGIAPVYLYWAKYGVDNFSTLKGYVIFAFPQYMYEDKADCGNFVSLNKTFEFRAGLSFPLITDYEDPVRKLAARLISEDTTYYPYKHKLEIDTINNAFIAERVMRWQFALKIFTTEFSVKQKIFGGGFDFLNWFGYRFENNRKISDYPHNPLLTILLYSGVLGLLLYLLFLYRAVYYYIKHFRKTKILFIFFAITFFFAFFSAGSPFDPPVLGFFILLPYFIHFNFK